MLYVVETEEQIGHPDLEADRVILDIFSRKIQGEKKGR